LLPSLKVVSFPVGQEKKVKSHEAHKEYSGLLKWEKKFMSAS